MKNQKFFSQNLDLWWGTIIATAVTCVVREEEYLWENNKPKFGKNESAQLEPINNTVMK